MKKTPKTVFDSIREGFSTNMNTHRMTTMNLLIDAKMVTITGRAHKMSTEVIQ